MFNTYEELKTFCQEQDIKMIDFKMVDLLGRWRHLTAEFGYYYDL